MKKKILFLSALLISALLLLGGCGGGGTEQKTVTFVYNNGTPSVTVVVDGALAAPTPPTKEGYAFVGWTPGSGSSGELYVFGSVPKDAHLTLTAVWREMPESVLLTVHPENGGAASTLSYRYHSIPSVPATPIFGGYDFMGWYADPDCRELFDFSKPLTASADVYAGWRTDPVSLGNKVALEILPSTVKIHTTRSSATLMSVSLGSGVIYASSGGYYYLLTNAHVVSRTAGYSAVTYKVIDAYGNEYTAYLMAASNETDLAVLRFAAGEEELPAASFAAADPEVGSLLISVGNPSGLTNCATYGRVTRYAAVDVAGANSGYTVGWHDAPIDNGSSGGAVYDAEGRIVGINFAAATDSSGNFAQGAFIQRSLVVRFLTDYNLAL